MEKFTGRDGIFSTADPLISVRQTRIHHSLGGSPLHNSTIELARTTHPATRTDKTYQRAPEPAARLALESDAVVIGVC